MAAASGTPRTPGSVLLVTPHWTAGDGGAEAHVRASAAVLAERGLRVDVLAARVDPDAHVEGVTVFHSPGLYDRDAQPRERFGDALASGLEVVHLHHASDPRLVEELRAAAPVVVSAHGYSACPSSVHYFRPGRECTRAWGAGCVPAMLLGGCLHARDPREVPAKYTRAGHRLQALLRADLAVAYSSAVDRHLAANGVTRRAVVPLFATTAARTDSKDGVGAGPGHTIPADSEHGARRRVLFAGRLVRPKGVAVLLRALRSLDAELVVCGEGRERPALRALARRTGIERRVAFRGWLSAEALAGEVADASVVALPSLWPEPFGLVGIEALTAGRPVVASAVGGVSDWLQDDVSGLLVPPGDAHALARALGELLDDPARREAMGAAGRATVAARFTPKRHVASLLGCYRAARATWEAR